VGEWLTPAFVSAVAAGVGLLIFRVREVHRAVNSNMAAALDRIERQTEIISDLRAQLVAAGVIPTPPTPKGR